MSTTLLAALQLPPDPDSIAVSLAAAAAGAVLTGAALYRHRKRTIAELKDRLAHFEMLATTDALTGVGNRRGLDQVWSTLTCRPNIALVDVNKLKWINDTHGHPVGDLVLTVVAQRLASIGATFRWGGDEFVVILPEGDPRSSADLIRWNTSARGDTPDALTELGVRIGVAVGVAEYSADLAEAVAAADPSLNLDKGRPERRNPHRGPTLTFRRRSP